MSEEHVEKRVVGRNVVTTLGITCVILVVILVGAIVGCSSVISGKDADISSLRSQIANLNDTINLRKSVILWNDLWPFEQEPDQNYTWWYRYEPMNSCGYLSIWVMNSTTNTTYVRCFYQSHGVNYNNQITVGTNGTAVFPILLGPWDNLLNVYVGRTNTHEYASEHVTITYYY